MKLSLLVYSLVLLPATLACAAKHDLQVTATTDQTFAVEVELRVGGDLSLKDMQAAAGSKEADAVRKLPMSVAGKLVYEEQRLSEQTIARYYRDAKATIKVEQGGKQPELTEGNRLILAQDTKNGLLLTSPSGALTREQIDLIEVIGATPYLDGLLPDKPLEEGEAWQVTEDVMRPLLGLDSVSVCEVSNVIDEANKGHVRFQVAGTVHGKMEGADTEFDIRGIGLFSLEHGCVTHLNLAVKEQRAVGPATPGFAGVAKVNITRVPVKTPKLLTEDRVAVVRAQGDPSLALLLEAQEVGFRVLHDRNWFQSAQTPTMISLRRVEQGALVAQATLSRIRSKSAAQQPTLADFESEVKQGVGESLTELISHDEWTNPSGARCLCVVARGKVEDLELEYRHYLILPTDGGRSVSLAVTLAVDDMAAVGGADRRLADAVELVQRGQAVANESRTVK